MNNNPFVIVTCILLLNCFNVFEMKAQNDYLYDEISSAVELVSQDSIESYIQHLENYGTRFMI